jgi:serine/threonine-protein kinase
MARDLFSAVQQALGSLYTLEREIGRGGGARVFLARTPDGSEVALKVLHPELAVTVAADRFLREVRLAGKLDHPNIAKLLDSGEVDWVVYYTMSYFPGPTLREGITRARSLPVDDVIRLANDLLGALQHAHGHNIVHRDVKPENILISDGKTMLLDFGIAKAIADSASENLTRSGVALGTCTYMSPEQIRGLRAIDHRSDLYSLACVLFECLTGHAPFVHKVEGIVLQKHLTEPPPRLESVRPDAPKALADVIDRALAKEPVDRWPTAAAMRQALPLTDKSTLP